MGLLESYSKYTEETEPNRNFHLLCVLTVVACAMGRRCYLARGHYNIFPECYHVLVGHPATKKSTAISLSRTLASAAGVKLASSSTSKEALIDNLEQATVQYSARGLQYQYQQLCVFANEYDMFIGGKHLSQGMVSFLTDIYESPAAWEEYTRKNGKKTLPAPTLCVLGAATPEWLRTNADSGLFGSGFMRRHIMLYEKRVAKFVANPTKTLKSYEAYLSCVTEVKRISQMVGTFVLTKAAEEAEVARYTRDMQLIESMDDSDRFASLWAAAQNHRIKLGMLVSAARSSSRIVTSQDLLVGDAIFNREIKNLKGLFAGVGRNEVARYADLVTKFLAKGPQSKSAIRAALFNDVGAKEFEELLADLVGLGVIRVKGFALDAWQTKYEKVGEEVEDVEDLFTYALTLPPCHEEAEVPLVDAYDGAPAATPAAVPARTEEKGSAEGAKKAQPQKRLSF